MSLFSVELKTTLIRNFADLVFTTWRLKDKSDTVWPHLKIQLKNACCWGINIIIDLSGVRCNYDKGNAFFSLYFYFFPQKNKAYFLFLLLITTTVYVTECAQWCWVAGVGAVSNERVEKFLSGDGKLEVEKWSYWNGPEEKSPCIPVFSDYAGLIKIVLLPIALAEADWTGGEETPSEPDLASGDISEARCSSSTTPSLRMKWRAFRYGTQLCLTDFIIEILRKSVAIQSAENTSSQTEGRKSNEIPRHWPWQEERWAALPFHGQALGCARQRGRWHPSSRVVK